MILDMILCFAMLQTGMTMGMYRDQTRTLRRYTKDPKAYPDILIAIMLTLYTLPFTLGLSLFIVADDSTLEMIGIAIQAAYIIYMWCRRESLELIGDATLVFYNMSHNEEPIGNHEER